GVAKTTANLPKHLTWFLASFNTPTDIPGIVDQVCHCRRYVRNHNALRIALDTDLAAGLRHPQRRHLPRLSSERPTTPLLLKSIPRPSAIYWSSISITRTPC